MPVRIVDGCEVRLFEFAMFIILKYNKLNFNHSSTNRMVMMEKDQDYKNYVPFLESTLRDCGVIVVDSHKDTPPKGLYLNEVVSANVSNLIRKAIIAHYPHHHLYTKGSKDNGVREYEWICDPLDGAFIYTKGFSSVVISMTLVHKGTPVLTGILQPFSNDMYVAVKDQGVTKNKQQLKEISNPLGRYGMINSEWWPAAEYDVDTLAHNLSIAHELYPVHIGSVVYSACLVAEGVLVACVFGGKLIGKNHEAAAVMLLMQEIGGRYTDLFGKTVGFKGVINGFIISTKQSHGVIVNEAKKILDD